MYFEEKGAYTGEISPNMLVDAGVKYVILGHSERRGYFGETDADINKKMKKAFEHGLTPIMCCGESLEQREQGVTMDFIRQQVKIGFRSEHPIVIQSQIFFLFFCKVSCQLPPNKSGAVAAFTDPPYWIRISAAVASS